MNLKSHISIKKRKIGAGFPAFIIAELSANHHQSLPSALHLVRAAKKAGADAVKIQTYTADTLTLDCDNRYFRIRGGTVWDGKTLHKLYQEAYTPWKWHAAIKTEAEKLGLIFFSSPFDPTAVDFLERLSVPAYKVASFEIVDLPLIERIARTKKPIILSTGMAALSEIQQAVQAAADNGCSELALLKCTSAYPAPPEEMRLRTIADLARRFKVPVGLSDHTLGITVPVSAVCLGGSIIEKHLTLSRKVKGPDSSFSLEPSEFSDMVRAVRTAEKALGKVCYGPSAHERSSLSFRRSLFAVENIPKGDALNHVNIRSIRPAYGLPPKELNRVLGKKAKRLIKKGTPLSWALLCS